MDKKNYTVEAIVLKRINFGEKDRLVTLLSPNYGKVRAIAKGCRRPGSKLSGHMELFGHVKVYLARGRNLDIVSQAETMMSSRPVLGNLDMLGWLFYVAELIDIFSNEGEENYPLFKLVSDILVDLPVLARTAPAVCAFEFKLIHLLGYKPDLDAIKLEPLGPLWWSPARHSFVPAAQAQHMMEALPLSAAAVHVLREMELGETTDTLLWQDAAIEEVRCILRTIIESACDKRLKSPQFREQINMLAS